VHDDQSPRDAFPDLKRLGEELTELEQRLHEINKGLLEQSKGGALPVTFTDEASIRRLLKARRMREQQLGAHLFSDPAWDILLEALAAEMGQKRMSVSRLCEACAVQPTTALRWINALDENGYLTRGEDPLDARGDWIELTAEGSVKLQRYLQDVALSLLGG
jgi:DNA-binding MarR family transcriptional regulator